MRPPAVALLLPGLDGTGLFTEPFAAAAPESIETRIVRYPADRSMELDDYVAFVLERLPSEPVLLVGESFSGPVAVRIAAEAGERVAALVLVNTYVTPARPHPLAALPLRWFAGLPGGDHFLAWLLAGSFAGSLVKSLGDVRRALGPAVVASRVRIALSVDERASLAATRMPLLDLRGTNDRLVPARHRNAILAARPDALLRDVVAPHALLLTRPAEAWMAIASAGFV